MVRYLPSEEKITKAHGIKALKMKKALAASLLVIATAIPAYADVIYADPTQYASGTDISNSFEGVTLSTFNIAPILSYADWFYGDYTPVFWETPIYSMLCSPCSRDTGGQTVFSPDGVNPNFLSADTAPAVIENDPSRQSSSWRAYGTHAFMARFDEGASYLALVGAGKSTGDFLVADLWDTEGKHIGRCVAGDSAGLGAGTPCVNRYLVNPDLPDSYYSGQWEFTYQDADRKVGFITAGGYSGNQYVRSLTYSVPEPASTALLIPAFGMLLLSRRKYKMS